MKDKRFRVKILDMSFQQDYLELKFRYLFYNITAPRKEDAIKIAKDLYMKGDKEVFSEELPFLLKLFTIDDNQYVYKTRTYWMDKITNMCIKWKHTGDFDGKYEGDS